MKQKAVKMAVITGQSLFVVAWRYERAKLEFKTGDAHCKESTVAACDRNWPHVSHHPLIND